MIIYNVTIKVEHDASEAWVVWMKNQHIPDLLNTGLFMDTRLCHLLEQDDTEGSTYVAQYFCQSMEEYNTYINEYATGMREKAAKAFGGKFVAFRTVMEII